MKNKDSTVKWTDFHCHFLPGMDPDAVQDVEQSKKLLKILQKQGVGKVYATSHFYSYKESVESYCERRERALEIFRASTAGEKLPEIVVGAEVLISQELSMQKLSPLAAKNPDIILLELPYMHYARWMASEIENAAYQTGALPVIAHIDRYGWLTGANIDELCAIDGAVIQVNCSALDEPDVMKRIERVIRNGRPVVLGSDSHNLVDRMPDFDKANKFGVGALDGLPLPWMPNKKRIREAFLDGERRMGRMSERRKRQ